MAHGVFVLRTVLGESSGPGSGAYKYSKRSVKGKILKGETFGESHYFSTIVLLLGSYVATYNSAKL